MTMTMMMTTTTTMMAIDTARAAGTLTTRIPQTRITHMAATMTGGIILVDCRRAGTGTTGGTGTPAAAMRLSCGMSRSGY